VNERLPPVSAQNKLRVHHRLPLAIPEEHRHAVAEERDRHQHGDGGRASAALNSALASPAQLQMITGSAVNGPAAARYLVDTGLIGEFFPELPAMRLEQEPTHRHEDVLAHMIAVVNNVARAEGNPTTSRRTR
jgi:hypothetical protein